MNYLDQVADRIAGRSGLNMEDADERRLCRLYAVLALAKGEGVTLEDVHDAWAAWRMETAPTHRALLPFKSLATEVQELDLPYAVAIRAVAREMREGAA